MDKENSGKPMTDSLIERVARALAEDDGFNPDQEISAAIPHHGHTSGRPFYIGEEAFKPAWHFYARAARAAIAAMREPTQAMRAAMHYSGSLIEDSDDAPPIDWDVAGDAWRAAIDAALKG